MGEILIDLTICLTKLTMSNVFIIIMVWSKEPTYVQWQKIGYKLATTGYKLATTVYITLPEEK